MIKVTEIKVELTRLGPQQYEKDVVGLTATPEEGANVQAAILEMKRLILGEISSIQGTAVAKEEVKVETKTSSTKAKGAKNQKANEGEPQVSTEKAPEQVAQKTFATEEEAQAVVDEAKTQMAEKEKKATKVKTKATPYDRTDDTHKKKLKNFLDVAKPGWNSPENLPKAGKASAALVGKDFLDTDGQTVLDSFKEAFLAYL